MISDEEYHIFPQGVGCFQTEKNIIRHLGAGLIVPIEMTLTVISHGKGLHLADVMQKCRPAKSQVFRYSAHHMGGVSKNIIGMMVIVLFKSYGRRKFWDDLRQNGGKSEELLGIDPED